MRKIPPLNAIRAFEAAARLVSFTKAGEELNVTHGAISRQVAILENYLGVILFRRTNAHLELTSAGKKLLDETSAALDRIAVAAMHVSNASNVELTVSAPPTFTLRWLIPRFSTFQRKHLDLKVRLVTSIEPVDFSSKEYDIAIRGAVRQPDAVNSHFFLTESILPVCHPDLLEKQPLKRPQDIARHTLLTYSTEPYRWADWRGAVGASDIAPLATINFEQMYFALQAAMEGLGIALVPYFLVIDDIAAGRLCTPFGSLGVQTRAYYANVDPGADDSAARNAFCNWLEEEGKATMALCDQQMDHDL
ncbi:MAG: LysR family transcriptional regulator [Herbaspirillum sp.]|jgi:LysR family glycine cleavage system transcriptional activator|nr:LysR family transcriptional regulator [Herbaspirillum sp.]